MVPACVQKSFGCIFPRNISWVCSIRVRLKKIHLRLALMQKIYTFFWKSFEKSRSQMAVFSARLTRKDCILSRLFTVAIFFGGRGGDVLSLHRFYHLTTFGTFFRTFIFPTFLKLFHTNNIWTSKTSRKSLKTFFLCVFISKFSCAQKKFSSKKGLYNKLGEIGLRLVKLKTLVSFNKIFENPLPTGENSGPAPAF